MGYSNPITTMAWYTEPQTGTSLLTLPYDMGLHLEEIRGGFVLTWLHKTTPIQQWSLNTPSLYEARARSMEIMHEALKESARYLVSSLPVIAYTGPALEEVTACMPKYRPPCPPCNGPQECECKPPTYKYSMR